MIDLHVHTNNSDGSDSVIELLQQAERAKLELISITDHDNCFAYNELNQIEVPKYFTGTIIRGVELAASCNGMEVELLGYGVDVDVINEKAIEIRAMKKKFYYMQFQKLYERCLKLNVRLDDGVMDRYVEGEYFYPSSYLHKEIVKHQENKKFFGADEKGWENHLTFGVTQLGNVASPLYIDVTEYLPTCDYIYDLIKKANGLVFIPHIFAYNEKALETLEYFTKNFDIDGIECFYSRFTKEQSSFLVNYCKNHHYFISGGSDYHGIQKPDIKIGTGVDNNIDISRDTIKDWLQESMLYAKCG